MNNSRRGFIVPLLLAIIGILIVGGGTYVYMSKKPAITQTTPVDSSVPASNTDSQKTSSWKTYKNEEYGFEFKYPTSTVINDTPDGVVTDKNIFRVEINVGGHGRPVGFAESATSTVHFAGFTATKSIEWGVDEREVTDPEIGVSGKYTYQTLFFDPKIGLNIHFHFSCHEGKEKCDVLFNEILATFKFAQ